MHAFLLKNSDPNEFAKKQNAKVIPFTLQKIEDARELKKLVKFSLIEKTAIVINDIDKATIEASNAFLKNLEEPNNNLIYILTANNLEGVLPTIASRCQIIQFKKEERKIKNTKPNFKDALNIKDREEGVKFIEDLINIDHTNSDFNNMENYLQALQSLKVNGNVSLQLMAFVVRMNGHGK